MRCVRVVDGKEEDAAEVGVIDESGEDSRSASVSRRHVTVLEPGGVGCGRAELEGRDDAMLGFLGDVVCVVKVGEDASSVEVRTEKQAADRSGEA